MRVIQLVMIDRLEIKINLIDEVDDKIDNKTNKQIREEEHI